MSNTRRVVVLSGLAFSGKSTLIEEFMKDTESAFAEFAVFYADPYRARLQERLGRPLLIPEHRFKNEALYLDMKTEVVFGGLSVIIEMALKTNENHYNPLAETMWSVNRYLSAIHLAKVVQGLASEEGKVECAVISLYCDVETVRRRARQRAVQIAREGNTTQTDVFDLKSLRHSGVKDFEFPTSIEPLFVDTSDESLEQVKARFVRIKGFIFGGQMFAPHEYEERRRGAVKALAELRVAVEQE
jgi:deoxyadenosine/deoxycytidine kinase